MFNGLPSISKKLFFTIVNVHVCLGLLPGCMLRALKPIAGKSDGDTRRWIVVEDAVKSTFDLIGGY
jgi:hypothetical protein